MNKKLIVCVLMCFGVCVMRCNAQYWRLTHLRSRTDVSLDLNRVYNYNSYERNRWGVGFDILHPLKYDTRFGRNFQNALIGWAYVGYGTGDKAWKYGGSVGFVFPRNIFNSIIVGYQHDLLRVGSHSFDDYNVFNTSDNSSYFSSHFCSTDRISVVSQIDILGPGKFILTYSHSRERYLFDASGLLYPSINEDEAMPYMDFNEAIIDLYWGDHWKFELMSNIVASDDNIWRITSNPLFALDYIRFLAEYKNKIDFKNNNGQLSIFAQGGIVNDDVPVSRRFDLGGTGGGWYYFNNTFLTVRPNTFMSEAFTLASIRYTMGKGLWKNALSEPRPFVQMSAMWGMLFGKSIENGSDYYPLGDNKYITLTAPIDGLAEPCLGIDGLIHWGVLDMGVAAAYQLTPKNSHYHLDNFLDKFAVMFVAKLIID